MDFQEVIENKVASDRAERMKTSPQLTLGELIARLEGMPTHWDKGEKGEKNIVFDFEYAIPTGLESWRGSYNELALTFDFKGYDHFYKKEPKPIKITAFIKMLKEAIGKEYTGWKGGKFVMGKNTPIWVANSGNSGNTGVIGVFDNEYELVLLTGRCEY